MTNLPYTLDDPSLQAPPIGLIVLQADETLEPEFKSHFAAAANPLYVSRIKSGAEVSTQSLGAMQDDLTAAANLLPKARPFGAVGYGCTSASSVIGSHQVAALIKAACDTPHVTNPLEAAIAYARHLGVAKLALVSPYVEEVNQPLRQAFAAAGLSTDVFGSFNEPLEANVVRISVQSVVEAAVHLGRDPSVEAVFLSCTNLRTLEAIPRIEAALQKPVLSSNQVLAWHLKSLLDA